MALRGVQHEIGVKSVGVNVTLPENDVAYLMYYLNCVLKGCGLDIIQDDLIDWKNYHRLSSQRQDQVFLAAYKYSPDELLDKTIFHDDDGSVCGDKENVFLRISEDLKLFHAQANVLIVGEKKRAASIMVFRKAWLDKFYTNPMKRNVERLKRAMIGLISNHCEHCAGRSGRCTCDSCPRTSESQCSRSLAITGIMGALSEALEEAVKEAEAKSAKIAECDHCDHCKGFEASCGCEEGCFKPSKSKCITVHKRVLCDGCRDESIVGARYKCADCFDYDLCQDCYRGRKHNLSHSFHLIERVGSQWKRLEPRMKPNPVSITLPSPPPRSETKASTTESSSGVRKGFFYEDMSIAEMKSYLHENGIQCDGILEKEDLRREVWECYCDSVSANELAQVIIDAGLDASGCRHIKSRRSMVKAAFRAAKRPVETSHDLGFGKDQIVSLCGLRTSQLNGMKGRVVNTDAGNGRLDVLLEDGRTVRVKSENLAADVEIID